MTSRFEKSIIRCKTVTNLYGSVIKSHIVDDRKGPVWMYDWGLGSLRDFTALLRCISVPSACRNRGAVEFAKLGGGKLDSGIREERRTQRVRLAPIASASVLVKRCCARFAFFVCVCTLLYMVDGDGCGLGVPGLSSSAVVC